MNNIRKKKEIFGIIIAVALMLISMVGAFMVQTAGGKVEVKDLRFETSMGYEMSALLYKPKTATAENKAPAVITCHGMYNNREMQDINLVELSRRGYVVLAIDMFSHGNSQNLSTEDALPMGVTEALKMFSTLSYVDTERIGLTGHSLGGLNCDIATLMDNQNEKPLVKALLLNSCFATYKDAESGNYVNVYGDRDVGIIAGQYDEFLFKEVNADGTKLLPKDFIKSDNAQSFLNFGRNPGEDNVREANTLYHELIGKNDALRVIYNPAITHPWSHFSKRSAKATIEFFEEALPAPKKVPASNQMWQWKEFFNAVGLVGFAMFALYMMLLLTHIKLFNSLVCVEEEQSRTISPKRRYWNIGITIIVSIFSAVTYIPIVTGLQSDHNGKLLFAQNTTFGIGVWAAICGLFMILCMLISYKNCKKEDSFSLKEVGISIGKDKICITIFAAAIVSIVTYLWVGIADYFFKTDFRIWVLAAKSITSEKIGIVLFPNLLLFLIFYISNSIFTNCFSYEIKEEKGEKHRGDIQAAFISVLPTLILVGLQYIHLFRTGKVLFEANNAHSMILWLVPMLVMIPAATVISRKVYRETKNPYLPGIVNAVLITLMTCANTSTWR